MIVSDPMIPTDTHTSRGPLIAFESKCLNTVKCSQDVNNSAPLMVEDLYLYRYLSVSISIHLYLSTHLNPPPCIFIISVTELEDSKSFPKVKDTRGKFELHFDIFPSI